MTATAWPRPTQDCAPCCRSCAGRSNCTVRPPRQIDSLAIDSSAFNKLRGDAYRLSVTLKNQASTEVAMPALELTLTDAQDQAVVRRVLMPAELGAHPGVIAAGSEWSGSVALAVAPSGAATGSPATGCLPSTLNRDSYVSSDLRLPGL